MSPSLSELLKLPAGERAELAMALWESLSEAEREGELELTPEQAAELGGHMANLLMEAGAQNILEEVSRQRG